MSVARVPQKILVDSFEYLEYEGTDDYSKALYKEPVLITNVRIDQESSFSRSKEETASQNTAVVFCYAERTTPFLDFKKQSKVMFSDGSEGIIKKVIPVNEPFENKVWCYELEVI
ncbi:minor capsid protein [Listeria aquatica]|uniref:Minor capsid protein n=1 Tax=Listeria aquatica TaxID=1494960 RepID=A0A841ZSP2_9LIST|nr:putative minor capsid protein [Listeria aquatica]MBC1522414.1 minor capsid protein [Listeria aquatica]